MATLFISDLHLNADQPILTQQFIALLDEAKKSADKVYILGDLFDRWIGDDNTAAYLKPIYLALKNLTQEVPCYFIPGNRDFLIGEKFSQETGVQIISEPHIIDLYTIPTLLLHGDLLCTDDHAYQKYRQKTRQPRPIKRFLSTPLWFRKLVAYVARLLSLRHQKKHTLVTLDANQTEILRLLQHFGVQQLIYGHTHKPGIHYYWNQLTRLQWWVLGDWTPDHYSALWVYPDHSYQLMLEKYS